MEDGKQGRTSLASVLNQRGTGTIELAPGSRLALCPYQLEDLDAVAESEWCHA